VYQFFKTAVEQSPNADIQPVILDNISSRIPDHLKNSAYQQAVLADLLAEVQQEYSTTIRSFTGSLTVTAYLKEKASFLSLSFKSNKSSNPRLQDTRTCCLLCLSITQLTIKILRILK